MMTGAPEMDEELARAESYGLLSRLFYAPMDDALRCQLLDAMPATPVRDTLVGAALTGLVEGARSCAVADLAAEYDALFGGVGKPEVMLYGSHYLSGFLNDRPLAALRTDLARWGLERAPAMSEPEDHVAYLCQVMRWLIVGDDPAVANLGNQQGFFSRHLRPWVPALCAAIESHPAARFYAHAARFLAAFIDVEAEAFEMFDD
jgi:TorA maturation chaperone TorD